MTVRHRARAFAAAAILIAPIALLGQYLTPNLITTPGDVTTTVGPTVFINHGLVGVGRISASKLDAFGESFGSVSSMQITGWTGGPGGYHGTLNILPDRGYNSGNFYADYAARVQQVDFAFTPYTSAAPLGGATDADRIALQSQITFSPTITGTKFTYTDPSRGAGTTTTGLDPGTSFTTLFGLTMPYVTTYSGQRSPSEPAVVTYPGINKLPLDCEALILKADGSGYIGDEYGANIYYFDSSKNIIGAIVPPPSMQPHHPAGTPFFSSTAAPNPDNGRRPNQGLEGVALSPDGTRLFALLQSATMQDSDSNRDQTRRQTRLLVYDVSVDVTPTSPIAEYTMTLPTYRAVGDTVVPNTDPVNKTAAQSEVVAIDRNRILVLSRDGNGQGNASLNPSVFKSILLVDLNVNAPTNIIASDTAEGGTIATLLGGTGKPEHAELLPGITAVTWNEALNMLNTTQLNRFNINVDTGTGQVTKLTLGEKWEGMTIVPANDPAAPDDYFLFIGNDNDFLTSNGSMRGPDGSIVPYNGFPTSGYPASRIPAPVSPSVNNENDTMVLAFRVTISVPPTVTRGGLVLDRRSGKVTQQVTLTNTTQNALSGPIYLVLDTLSANATLLNPAGTTTTQLPAGSPYVLAMADGATLAPGASVVVTLQFADPSAATVTYTTRVLVSTVRP